MNGNINADLDRSNQSCVLSIMQRLRAPCKLLLRIKNVYFSFNFNYSAINLF